MNTELWDAHLTDLEMHGTPVRVYLNTGIKMIGTLRNHDDACVLLEKHSHAQLVLRHNISTIEPDQ